MRPRGFPLAPASSWRTRSARIVVHRQLDHQRDQQVAPPASGLLRPSCGSRALEAQRLARGRALGHLEHHRAVGRRHAHLGAEHRLGQASPAGRDGYRRLRAGRSGTAGSRSSLIASPAPPRSFLALAGKAHLGAGFEPGRKLQVDRLAVAQRGCAVAASVAASSKLTREAIRRCSRPWRRPAAEIAKASGEAPAAPPQRPCRRTALRKCRQSRPLRRRRRNRARKPPWPAAAHARAEAAERIHGIAVAIDLAAIETGALVLVGQQVA